MLTLKLELKVDVQDDQQREVIITATKQLAKQWKTLAMLMGTRRVPQIALYGKDFFCTEAEIDMADDLPVTLEGNDAVG